MMMGFGFLGMFLFWAILLALFVGSAVLGLRQTAGSRLVRVHPGLTSQQILNRRLARGEISEEEYEMIRAQIER